MLANVALTFVTIYALHHAKFGCILFLHSIPTLYLYHSLHYHGRLFTSLIISSYINISLAYVAIVKYFNYSGFICFMVFIIVSVFFGELWEEHQFCT